jgi:hypothetical protein
MAAESQEDCRENNRYPVPVTTKTGALQNAKLPHCEPVSDVTASADRVTRFSRVALVWQSVSLLLP